MGKHRKKSNSTAEFGQRSESMDSGSSLRKSRKQRKNDPPPINEVCNKVVKSSADILTETIVRRNLGQLPLDERLDKLRMMKKSIKIALYFHNETLRQIALVEDQIIQMAQSQLKEEANKNRDPPQ